MDKYSFPYYTQIGISLNAIIPAKRNSSLEPLYKIGIATTILLI